MATTRRRRQKPIARTTGKGGNYRPTKKGAGMTRKGIKEHRRKNPGSKLQAVIKGKKDQQKRRKSYCARSLGQLKRSSAKTRNNPNSRIDYKKKMEVLDGKAKSGGGNVSRQSQAKNFDTYQCIRHIIASKYCKDPNYAKGSKKEKNQGGFVL